MSSRQSPKGGDIPGAVFNEDELARQLANSTGFDRLFAKSRLDSGSSVRPCPCLSDRWG